MAYLRPWSQGDSVPFRIAHITEVDGENTTRSVDENTAADGNVGSAVSATDANNDTLTDSLSGTDAGSFAIGSSTGQITVGTGTALDYETKNSYEVTVSVTRRRERCRRP